MNNKLIRRFFSFEKLSLGYIMVTTIMIVVSWNQLDHPLMMILGRFAIITGMVVISYFTEKYFRIYKVALLIRILFQISLLPIWYPEIYEFNKLFPNLDHIFASLEQSIFGLQPAVEFSNLIPQKWFSEAVYFGYFAFYPMIVGTIIYVFIRKVRELNRLAFIVLGSFFAFYLLFIFLPVSGPQFYYLAIGMENVELANFYPVADYFRYHTEILSGPGYQKGFFYRLIELVQSNGEYPIAAFPSSHIGISTILMLWTWHDNKKITFILLPIYLLLCCATVYIQAHYLIDVFAGWLTAFIFYYLFVRIYEKRFSRNMM